MNVFIDSIGSEHRVCLGVYGQLSFALQYFAVERYYRGSERRLRLPIGL